MCGRITNSREEREEFAKELGVPFEQVPLDYQARYNIAPMQDNVILRMRHEERELVVARWGLVNYWAKDDSRAARCVNAKAETVDTRPAFREAFQRGRCVVPCDGFYEWTGLRADRRPLWFHRPDGHLLMLAGLYERWQPAPGVWQRTFTMITCEPNDLLRPIQNRMPVVLDDDVVDEWLDPAHPNPLELKRLLVPAGEEVLVFSPASRKVNWVENEGHHLLRAS